MSKIDLDEEEKEVFNLIKEYLTKKSIINIIELQNSINHRLRNNPNYNKYKIEKIIKSLMKKKVILIGTRLSKEDVFTIQIRKNIYEFIQKEPGININDIKRKFNLGSNQVIWHVKMLNDFNFIRSVEIGNQNALFEFNFDKNNEYIVFYLRNEKVRDILKLLENNIAPLKPTKISESLNIHYNTVKKYLHVLLKVKIIEKVNGNKKTRYKLNQEVYSKLIKSS
jgi:predicted transcriptional regulator